MSIWSSTWCKTLRKGLLGFGFGVVFLRINVLGHLWREIELRQYPMSLQWIALSMRCYVLDKIFALLWEKWVDINPLPDTRFGWMSNKFSTIFGERHIICLWVFAMSWYPFCTIQLDFQSNEDSRRSTFRYVYIPSGFYCFYNNKGNLFCLWAVPLAISSKILLCDNSEMVTWSKELKYH